MRKKKISDEGTIKKWGREKISGGLINKWGGKRMSGGVRKENEWGCQEEKNKG